MDLPDDVLAMIDGYVSNALSATGTRRTARGTNAPPLGQVIELYEPDPDPKTQPDAVSGFEDEESYAWQLPALDTKEPAVAPVFEIDEDEITAVFSQPT